MNGCNLRGFLIVSGGNMSTIAKSTDQFKKNRDGYTFYFPNTFDTFQNMQIFCSKEIPIYLKKGPNNEYYLGTNAYTIFPNTIIPLSYPFFAYRTVDNYLFVPITAGEDLIITITYESSILNKETMEEINKISSFNYYSYIYLKNNELYTYKKDKIHAPISFSLEYRIILF
jgi:hypothetical protein